MGARKAAACAEVGLAGPGRRSNGLAELAGTWTPDDVAQMEAFLRIREEVDEELWRGLRYYCLDTSAYVRFKGGDQAAVERIDSASWIGVPTIVVGELEAGFRRGSRLQQSLDELEQVPGSSAGRDDRCRPRRGGCLRRDRRFAPTRGKVIPSNDVWIAACAARSGATVHEHFEAIDRIGVLRLGAG